MAKCQSIVFYFFLCTLSSSSLHAETFDLGESAVVAGSTIFSTANSSDDSTLASISVNTNNKFSTSSGYLNVNRRSMFGVSDTADVQISSREPELIKFRGKYIYPSSEGDGSTGSQQQKSLVIIDSTVDDWQVFAEAAPVDADVVLIDKHGLHFNEAYMSYRSEFANPYYHSIHILSHGEQGTILIGDEQITLDDVSDGLHISSEVPDSTKSQLLRLLQSVITNVPTPPSLYLYGCNIAQGNKGKAFVNALAARFNLPVAASDDYTGGAVLGGDWELEHKTHLAQQYVQLFNEKNTAAYKGVLSTAVEAYVRASPEATVDGATSYKIFVVYLSNDSYESSVVGTDDIAIAGLTPSNASVVSSFGFDNSFTPPKGPSSITVEYTFTPPGGSWDSSDNSSYTVSLGTGPLTTQDGTAASSLGGDTSFDVNLGAVGFIGSEFDWFSGFVTGTVSADVEDGLQGHVWSTANPSTAQSWEISSNTLTAVIPGNTGFTNAQTFTFSNFNSGNYNNTGNFLRVDGATIDLSNASTTGAALSISGTTSNSITMSTAPEDYDAGSVIVINALVVSSGGPANGQTDVAANTDIEIDFGRAIQAGSGNIVISDGASDVRTISVSDATQVTISGSKVTINPTANLNISTTYNVQFSDGVFQQASDSSDITGFSASDIYSFTTSSTLPNNVPSATITSAPDVSSAGGSTYTVTVSYNDTDGTISAASIGDNDIQISPALSLGTPSIDSGSGTATTVVSYPFTPPGGTWDTSDNNTYTISLGGGPVEDDGGGVVASLIGGTPGTSFTVAIPANDATSDVAAGDGVDESSTINVPTTAITSGAAVDIFDFAIVDNGATDSAATTVTAIDISVSGAGNDKLTYVLTNATAGDVSNRGSDLTADVTGSYSSGTVTFDLSSNNIAIANNTRETYVVKAFFNNASSVTDNSAITVSMNADSVTADSGGSTMATPGTTVDNSGNTALSVIGTTLVFTTQPDGAVSGLAFTTPPVITVRDAAGNTDTDAGYSITLAQTGGEGSLSDNSVTASSGVATFSNITYTAASDADSNFTLAASGNSLSSSASDSVDPDVVATKLIFDTEPAPTSITSGVSVDFTTDPVIHAVDANDTLDTGYTSNVTLSIVDAGGATLTGGHTVNSFSSNADPDGGSETDVTQAVSGGIATFTGLALQYTLSGAADTIEVRADDSSLTAVNSTTITATTNSTPTISVDDNPTYNESGAVTLDASVTIVDDDGEADLQDGYISFAITNNSNANDSLTLVQSGTLALSGDDVQISSTTVGTLSASNSGVVSGSTALQINFNSNITAAHAQTIAQAIQFDTSADAPGSDRTVTFTINDGIADGTDTATVTISALTADSTNAADFDTTTGAGLSSGLLFDGSDETLTISDASHITSSSTAVANGGGGTDTLVIAASVSADLTDDNLTLSNFENLTLNDGATATLTESQHDDFTVSTNDIAGGAATESIILDTPGGSTSGAVTGDLDIEAYTLNGAFTYTLPTGATTQNVTGSDAASQTIDIGTQTLASGAALDGGVGQTDILQMGTGSDISATGVTISGFEQATITGSVTMTEAQHDGFSGGINASGSSDQITISAATDGLTADADVETYVLGAANSITLGAAGQNVTGSTGDDTVAVGASSATGAIAGGTGTDTLTLDDGGSISGANVTSFENLSFGISDTSVSIGATQLSQFSGTISAVSTMPSGDTINIVGNDDFTTFGTVDIETYSVPNVTTDSSDTRTITLGTGHTSGTITADSSDDAITFDIGTQTFAGTLTGAGSNDTVQMGNGSSIASATLNNVSNVTIESGASVTMTEAQHDAFGSNFTASGTNTITISAAGGSTNAEMTANSNVENYTLGAAINLTLTSGQSTGTITGSAGNDTITVGTLTLGAGTIDAGDGTDTLSLGNGADIISSSTSNFENLTLGSGAIVLITTTQLTDVTGGTITAPGTGGSGETIMIGNDGNFSTLNNVAIENYTASDDSTNSRIITLGSNDTATNITATASDDAITFSIPGIAYNGNLKGEGTVNDTMLLADMADISKSGILGIEVLSIASGGSVTLTTEHYEEFNAIEPVAPGTGMGGETVTIIGPDDITVNHTTIENYIIEDDSDNSRTVTLGAANSNTFTVSSTSDAVTFDVSGNDFSGSFTADATQANALTASGTVDIASAALSGFTNLNLNGGTNNLTLTAEQLNAFSGTITASGADTLTFSATGSVTGGNLSAIEIFSTGAGGNITVTAPASDINGKALNVTTADSDSFTVTGSAGSQTINGSAGGDNLSGGADADNVNGNDGNDKLDGGAGADILAPGAGTDSMTGGEGNDTFSGADSDLNGDTIEDLSAGDIIRVTGVELTSDGSAGSNVVFNSGNNAIQVNTTGDTSTYELTINLTGTPGTHLSLSAATDSGNTNISFAEIPPAVTSIDYQTPSSSPTTEDSVTWRVIFSEDVSNVGTADFSVSGGTSISVTNVSLSTATTYDVTASGGNLADFTGNLTLSFASGQDIVNSRGTALTTTTPTGTNNAVWAIDNSAPTVNTIVRSVPSGQTTDNDDVTWRVTFSEDVVNVGTADFSVSGTTATAQSVNQVSGNAAIYDVGVSGGDLGTLNGSISLSLGSHDITDTAGNDLTNTTPSSTNQSYTLDNTAPTVQSVTTTQTSPTNVDSVDFSVRFTEFVNNVDISDFTLSTTGTATGTIASVGASVGTSITVTVNNISGEGTLRLDVKSSGTGIVDQADIDLSGGFTSGTTLTIDNTAPTISEVTPVTTPGNNTTPGYTFTTSEAGTLSMGGSCGTSTSTTISSTGEQTITLTQTDNSSALADGTYSNCTVTVTDAAGNASSPLSITSFVIDATAPVISGVAIQDSAHKVNDTVTATITVDSDSDDYSLSSSSVAGYSLTGLNKSNDTTYTATFSVTDGGTDYAASANIPVSIVLTDTAGNSNTAFTTAISQASDAIYANLPDITLSASTNTISEDSGSTTLTAAITNTLNNSWPEAVTVTLKYTGTATNSVDYTASGSPSASSLSITAGQSSATATVTGTPDTIYDATSNETVIVDINGLSVGNESGGTQQQTITITDAQSAPTVTLNVDNSTIDENGGTTTPSVTLSNATFENVEVTLGYTGTATAAASGADYNNTASTTITVNAGSTTANAGTIITSVDDNDSEGSETIIIDVTGVSGGGATEATEQKQTVTITDDDNSAPTLINLNGTAEFTENSTAVVLDSDATVSDAESDRQNSDQGNYTGSLLTIVRQGGASTHDVFSVQNGSQMAVSGPDITTIIGDKFASFSSSSGTLTVTFSGDLTMPTTALVNEVLRNITYSNSSEDPSTSVVLNWTFSDGSLSSSGSTNITTVTVTPVNDAPTLDDTQSPVLTTIAEDEPDSSNTGTTVAAIVVDNSINNIESAQTTESIAVTNVDNTNGVWQYTTDNGTNWTAFSATTGSAVDLTTTARLLSSSSTNNKIRFVPDSNVNGAATFTFRAWDEATGTNGTTADVTTNGDTTAFSSNTDTAMITITAGADDPVIGNLTGDTLTYVQDSGLLIIDQSGDATLTDPDGASLSGGSLTVSITSGKDAAEDRLAIDGSNAIVSSSLAGGNVIIGATTVGTLGANLAAGADFIVNFNTNATTSNIQTLLRNITYQNLDTTGPTTGNRTVTFTLSDGSKTTTATTTVTVNAVDSDATAASGSTTSSLSSLTTSTPADLWSFTLSDPGTADGKAVSISSIVLNTSGTLDAGLLTYTLTDSVNSTAVTGVYSSNTVTFTGNYTVANSGSNTFTVSALFGGSNTVNDGSVLTFSLDADTDITTAANGTRMATSSAISSSGTSIDVLATQLVFTTQPAGSVSGIAFTTQPVIQARDIAGNLDTDFNDTITLTEASNGNLSGTTSIVASSGVASFSDLVYTATADSEAFVLTANDTSSGTEGDLVAVNANSVTSDVVATTLTFTTQPAPTSLNSEEATSFTTVPVVSAVNAQGTVDTGFTTSMVLTENGAGTALISGTGDTDNSASSVTLTPVSGVATFSGLSINYTASGASAENFSLQAAATGVTSATSSSITAITKNTDATVIGASGVAEPVAIATTADGMTSAVPIFDFSIVDGGTSDNKPLNISQIVINVSGTLDASKLVYLLNGNDVTNATGTYLASANTITFSGLSISVAHGTSETYTLSAYYSDNTNVTEGQTLILSTDGDTDFTVDANNTQMTATSPVTNGTGSTVDITATQLVFTSQPAGSVSGIALTTQPVVQARDAAGNVDIDFTELVTLTETSAGSVSNATATAVAGVASFSGVTYTASADNESVTFSANDVDATGSDLPAVNAAGISSNVVATRVVFATQPAPLALVSGVETTLTTVPVLSAVDANGTVDLDYISTALVSEVNGPGSVTLSATTDFDVDNATVTAEFVSGSLTLSGAAINYTVAGNGNETFNLQVASGSLTSATSSAFSVNDGPGIAGAPASLTVIEDVVSNVDLSGVTLSDTDGDNLTLTLTVAAGNISSTDGNNTVAGVTIAGAGASTMTLAGSVTDLNTYLDDTTKITYSPVANDDTSTTLTITANDGTVDSASSTVPVGITPVNDAPTIDQGATTSVTMSEDSSPTDFSLTLSASDIEGSTISWSVDTQPGSGTATVNENGVVDYTPNADFTGIDTFVIQASDGDLTDTIIVEVTVSSVNDAPVINQGDSVSVTMSEDSAPIDFGLALTASDTEGSSIIWSVSASASNGSASVSSNGVVDYVPNANFNGSDSFAVTASDGSLTDTINVQVTVQAVNDAPVINQGDSVNVTMSEDSVPVDFSLTLGASDIEGSAVTWSVSSAASNGSASVSSLGVVDYTPNVNFSGSDSFVVTVNDGDLTDSITVQVTVSEVNDAPVIDQGSSVSVTMSEDSSPTAFSLTLTALDVETSAIIWSVSSSASNGSASISPSGVVAYTPNADFNGNDSFVVTASDGELSDTITVQTTVQAVNDAPVISGEPTTSIIAGNTYSFAPTASDVDTGDNLTFSASSLPTFLSIDSTTGEVTGSTSRDNIGTYENIVISVSDSIETVSLAAFTLNVLDSNNAPVIDQGESTIVTMSEDASPTAFALSLSATDENGDTLTWTVDGSATLGEASVDQSGVVSYVPNANANGSDSFNVTVSDSIASDTIAVTVIIEAVNDAPVISGEPATAINIDATYSFVPTATDIEDDALTFEINIVPGWAEFDSQTGALTGTPTGNDLGTSEAIVISVSDGDATASLDAFTITVVDPNFNFAPTVTDTSAITEEDVAVEVTLLGEDVNGDALTYSLVTAPANGEVAIVGNVATYTPVANFNGEDSFTYIANDGLLDSETAATVTITLTPVNDAPVISGEPGTQAASGIEYLFEPTASDVDGDTLSFSEQNLPGWLSIDSASGAVTGTPSESDIGTFENIIITVSDGSLSNSLAAFSITVVDPNANVAPVAQDLTVSTNEDTPVSITLLATDENGDDLTYSIETSPASGTIDQTGNVVTYTPNLNVGDVQDSLTFIANDGVADSNLATVTISIAAVNDAPVITGNPATTVRVGQTYSFTPEFSDIDSTSLTLETVNLPRWATFDGADGTISGTPGSSDVTTYSDVTIRVSDGDLTDEIVFTITVQENVPPQISGANQQQVQVGESYSFTPSVINSDNDTLSFTIENPPTWASFVFDSATGTMTGQPTAADIGTSSGISITVSDGISSANLPLNDISVCEICDPEAPVIGGSPVTSILEGQAYSFVPSASDANNDIVSFSIVNQPSWTNFNTLTGALSGTAIAGTYANIQITVTDSTELSSTLTPFTISVSAINNPPVVTGTPPSSVDQNATYSFTPTSISDPEGDTVEFSLRNNPAWLIVNRFSGSLSGTPGAADVGTTSGIQLVASDGVNDTIVGPFSITVNAFNTPPVFTNDTPRSSVAAGSEYSFSFSATDADAQDVLSFSVTGQPDWLSMDATSGILSGTAPADFSGETSQVSVSVSDGTNTVTYPSFIITVNAVNTAPVASNVERSGNEDSVILVAASIIDADNDILTVTTLSQPANGTLVELVGGWQYTPATNFNGTDSFTYEASDAEATSEVATVTINVLPVNDDPVATDDSLSLVQNAEGSYVLDVLANDTDVDGNALNISLITANLNNVTMGVNAENQILLTAPNQFTGNIAFNYSISDGNDGSDSANVNFVIEPNDTFAQPPVINGVEVINIDATALQTAVNLGTVTANDASGNSIAVEITGSTATDINQRIFRPGSNTVTWNAIDDFGNQATEVQTVNVRPLVNFSENESVEEGTEVDIIVTLNGDAVQYPYTVNYSVSGTADSADHDLADGTVTFTEDSVTSKTQQTLSFSVTQDNVAEADESIVLTLASTDNPGGSSEVTITISEQNQPPQIVATTGYSALGDLGADPSAGFGFLNNFNQVNVESGQAQGYSLGAAGLVFLTTDSTSTNTTVVINTLEVETFSWDVTWQRSPFPFFNPTFTATLTSSPVSYDFDALSSSIYFNTLPNGILNGLSGFGRFTANSFNGSLIFVPYAEIQRAFFGSVAPRGPEALVAKVGQNQVDLISADSFTIDSDSMQPLTNTANVRLTLETAQQEELPADEDSDGDQIPDSEEGYSDTDNDGIPDYLDAVNECNVLPHNIENQTLFVAESTSDVCLQLGDIARTNQIVGVRIDNAATTLTTDDTDITNVGGIFDVIMTDLPEAGVSPSIAIGQVAPVPANAVFRVYREQGGEWRDFAVNDNNDMFSAAGAEGICPPPGSTLYTPGLTEGDWCVLLRIEDGGSNDNDRNVDGTIFLFGGVGVALDNNLLPVAEDDVIDVAFNTATVIDVLANDSDPDSDVLTITRATGNFGSVIINPDSTLLYEPNNGYVGTDIVSYILSDGNGGTASANVTVTITANRAPGLLPDSVSTTDTESIEIDVLANDVDVDGDALTITEVIADVGMVSITENNTLFYVPVVGFTGIDIITYTVQDTAENTSSTTVSVMVDGNLAPVADDDSVTTAFGTSVTIDVLSNDNDPDGDTLTIVSANADRGEVSIDAGSLFYTPLEGFSGEATITYTISDGLLSADGTVTVTVLPEPVDPVEPTVPVTVNNRSSGGGSVNGLWLLVALMIAWRRRQIASQIVRSYR